MPAGIAKPRTNAMSMMIELFGLTLPIKEGASMILPLSAVAAREIEFSSRFSSSMR